MQYDYERFTPDRFQDFCQALIVASYPDTQCYPTGQGDGGRDGYSLADGAVVFQVKFRRDRLKGDDSFKLIQKAIEKELPKIEKLKDRGAEKYILCTNLTASSALDVGEIDRMQTYIDATLPIPGKVWWRSDIDGRLNNAYDIKWQFSEIITSNDLLRYLVESQLGEQFRRRLIAISGYLTAQYEGDEYVKFKQADLQASDLLALFIDVPITYRPMANPRRRDDRSVYRMIREIALEEFSETFTVSRSAAIGGASLLLHPKAQRNLHRTIIEGGPGQGKSTLAQYVCQTYRMKFLNKVERLQQLPAKHRLVPVKVPFKIDLRDLSSWLQGVNPMTHEAVDRGVTLGLESFIAAHITYLSGGQAFSVDDLALFLSATPALIFLDGLDEVASISERKLVVDAVSATANRMLAHSPHVQFIVTSRPAAVPNMPRFASEDWDYLSLDSITSDLIYEYTDRWSAARKISAHDTDEIKAILQDKLQSSHIKELARNAMQLTILLNLVHVRGQALPDHRTHLYDSYVDVFFNREADKHRVVKDHRQLLINLHGYLAWNIHSASENKQTSGRVGQQELKVLITKFLEAQDYDPKIVDDLLNGVVQRIVALVSRMEGTFEFEVQPLREYFAARHLYNTAPYSPVGRPRHGTKPDIFAAMAPSPYWLNVTRFYSGCYSVGELSGLAEQVEDSLGREFGSRGSFPRVVATSLLADRVFSQAPRVTARVANVAVDELTLRYAFRSRFSPTTTVELRLPADCGQDVIAEQLGNRTRTIESAAGRAEAGLVWIWAVPETKRYAYWKSVQPPEQCSDEVISSWFELARNAQVLTQLTAEDARIVRSRWPLRWHAMAASGNSALVASTQDEMEYALALADGRVELAGFDGTPLSRVMWLFTSGLVINGSEAAFFLDFSSSDESDYPRNDALRAMVADIVRIAPGSAMGGFHERTETLAASLKTWSSIIDSYDRALGRTWLSWVSASLSVEGAQRIQGALSINPEYCEPIKFVLEARNRKAEKTWWANLLSSLGTDPLQARVAILLIAKYATPSVLLTNVPAIDRLVESMSGDHFAAIAHRVNRSRGLTIPTKKGRDLLSASKSGRTMCLLAIRMVEIVQVEVSARLDDKYLSCNAFVANLLLEWLVSSRVISAQPADWALRLEEVARVYKRADDPFSGSLLHEFGDAGAPNKMPAQIAYEILRRSQIYPNGIVTMADQIVTAAEVKKIAAVGSRARREKWAANG